MPNLWHLLYISILSFAYLHSPLCGSWTYCLFQQIWLIELFSEESTQDKTYVETHFNGKCELTDLELCMRIIPVWMVIQGLNCLFMSSRSVTGESICGQGTGGTGTAAFFKRKNESILKCHRLMSVRRQLSTTLFHNIRILNFDTIPWKL